MCYRHILIVSISLYLFVFNVKADTIPCRYTNIQFHYGFIIPHSESIRDISHTNPVGIELNYGKIHTSLEEWRVFSSYWISGFSIRYFNYNYPAVLGSVFNTMAYAGPILSQGYNHIFSISGGAGLSYHTKIYHPTDNPLNKFFSTRISFPLYINANLKYRIAPRTFAILSGYYNHISNGGFKQPNKGINFPTVSLGIERFSIPFTKPDYNYRAIVNSEKRKPSITFQMLSSIRMLSDINNDSEKACFVYGFHVHASKPLGHIYSLNAGVEMIVDGYIKETILREGTNLDHTRFAFTLGQDFTLGKVIFAQHFGIYAYSPYKARNSVYQKYEFLYRPKRKFAFGVFLKSHLHVAEIMGVSINYMMTPMKRQ